MVDLTSVFAKLVTAVMERAVRVGILNIFVNWISKQGINQKSYFLDG